MRMTVQSAVSYTHLDVYKRQDYYRRSTVDEYVDIRNVDVQKDVVYFSVNYSVPDESVSIGWRTGYRLSLIHI